MPAELVVICPELTPGRGGVGDYTLRVVDEWRAVQPVFLVPQLVTAAKAYDAEPLGQSADTIYTRLKNERRVLVQYSAYGFHRFGYPRELLRALVGWKREVQGVLVVMFHEIWTFWPLLNKNRPLQWLHRRHIGAVTRCADAVYTSTRSQAEHLRQTSGRAEVEVLPVGANIRPLTHVDAHREPGLAIVFGLQLSRLTTLRQMQEHLRSLAARGIITRLVTVGGGCSAAGDREEQELIAALKLRAGAELRGAAPEEAISELLSRASFAVSAQNELSVTKSGTFIAYAAHGLNIISPHAAASRPEPLGWATHPAELEAGIDEAELRARAENLRAWHDRTCSWPRIAEEFARALRLDVPQPAIGPGGMR